MNEQDDDEVEMRPGTKSVGAPHSVPFGRAAQPGQPPESAADGTVNLCHSAPYLNHHWTNYMERSCQEKGIVARLTRGATRIRIAKKR